ncbi:MAG: damage-control phosphatase ARMT1 family protein [Promethearchaeia archaeon]
MILEPECLGCLIDQIYKALKMLKPDIEKERIIETQQKMMEFFVNTDVLHKPGPLIGKKTYELVSETLNDPDPYKEIKHEYNQIALEYYDQAKKIVNNADDPMFEAIAASALGNTIDFAAHHDVDLINDMKNFSTDNLTINDIPDFKKSLEETEQLLILGDNTGEIVFDKLLIETLQALYPDLEIIFSVREKPIINDATMEDAEFVGITDLVKVIEAPGTPGVEMSVASDEFKEYFYNKKGVILSKGQGNFESLYQVDVPDKDVYYLLKAKCSLMERIFEVELGDLIFKKKTDGF